MIRVLRIAHIDTEKTWRGGQQQVFSLIKGLQRKRYHNIVIAYKGGPLHAECLKEHIEVYPVKPFGEWDFVVAHKINRLLKKDHIDVVHAHSAHAVGLAAFSTLGTTIPSVATRRVDFKLKSHFFSKLKYQRMKKIIAISHGVHHVLRECGIPEEKISLVHSGVDFNRFHQVKPLSRLELGIPENVPLIGQVAALAPHKDQRNFLLALAELKKTGASFVAIFVGDGPLRAELEKMADNLDLKNEVRFVGFKKNPLDFLSAFDVFCLSSSEEGLGTSLIDAMALKIPIVATRVGGVPDLIEDGVTGFLVPPHQPLLLAAKLKDVINSRPHTAVVEAGYQKSLLFNIQHTVDQTAEIYQEIVSL